jgi:hypothetical protein
MPDEERTAWLASLRQQNPARAALLQTLIEEHRVLAQEGFLEQSPVPLPGPVGLVGLVAVAAVAAPSPGPPVAAARWRRLARVAVASGIVIAPWYGRIIAATGNPVFPFLAGVFGSSPWSPLGFHTAAEDRAHLGDLAVGLLRLPWDVVFARQRLGGNPPYSPIFLVALPALLVGAVVRPRVRVLLLTAAAYALAVFALLPDARYLLVALPLGCLAVGDTLATALAAAARRARRPRA